MIIHHHRFATVLLCLTLTFSIIRGQSTTPQLQFIVKHRVNAHGDEFNALAKNSDGQWAYVGTEKGDVIVWNLISDKLERRLHQPSAVHHLLAIDSNHVIAAGSNHHEPLNPLVRKWNVATGTFEDLPGVTADSFPSAAAVNVISDLVAVGFVDGTVIVWEASNNRVAAKCNVNEVPFGLAIMDRRVYVAGTTRESIRIEGMPRENVILDFSIDDASRGATEFLRKPGRYWYELDASPDRQSLVAYFRQDGRDHTVLIDPAARAELPITDGWELAWIDSKTFVRFENLDPAEILRLNNQRVISVRKLGRMQNDLDGRAFDQTGQIVNAEGTKAWATYRKGPGFLQFDLVTGKIRTLMDGPSGAYSISVNTKDGNEGIVATGGADGYVRLWKLSDFSLIQEYHVAANDEFVTEVGLTGNGQQAVVGVLHVSKTIEDRYNYPLQIMIVNLADGTTKKLFEMSPWQGRVSVIDDLVLYPAVDRMKLVKLSSNETVREFVAAKPIRKQILSSNKKSLALLDDAKVLTIFDVPTGKKISSHPITPDDYGAFAVTNDGRYFCQVSHDGNLLSWNTETGEITEHPLRRIQEMYTNVDFITLANDDKWLVTAGNHGDVGIFERTTGDLVCYEESGAAVFYAEKAWLMGDRLIFSTDTGVLFDGRLVSAGQR